MDPFPYEPSEAAARRLSLDPYSPRPPFRPGHRCPRHPEQHSQPLSNQHPSTIAAHRSVDGVEGVRSEHVLGEIYAGFAKLSSPGASADQMQSRFEREYLPRIRWVSIDDKEVRAEALRELLVSPAPQADLKQRIATVLARASQLLLAAEILDLVVTHFAKDMFPPPNLAEVRSQLRTG